MSNLVAYRFGQLPVWIDVHLCEPIDIDRLSGRRRIYYRVPVSELSGLPVSVSQCNTTSSSKCNTTSSSKSQSSPPEIRDQLSVRVTTTQTFIWILNSLMGPVQVVGSAVVLCGRQSGSRAFEQVSSNPWASKLSILCPFKSPF